MAPRRRVSGAESGGLRPGRGKAEKGQDLAKAFKEAQKPQGQLERRVESLLEPNRNSDTCHAAAKTYLFWAISESMQSRPDILKAHHAILRSWQLLQEAVKLHRSLPSALFYGRLLCGLLSSGVLSGAQQVHVCRAVAGVLPFSEKWQLRDSGIEYEDGDLVFGDVMLGDTPEEQMQNAEKALRELSERVYKLDIGERLNFHLRNPQPSQDPHSLCEALLKVVQDEPALMPGWHCKVKKFAERAGHRKLHKSMQEDPGLRRRRRDEAGLKGEDRKGGKANKDSERASQEMQEKVKKYKAMLLARLQEAPAEKRSEVAQQLLTIDRELLERHFPSREAKDLLTALRSEVDAQEAWAEARTSAGSFPEAEQDAAARAAVLRELDNHVKKTLGSDALKAAVPSEVLQGAPRAGVIYSRPLKKPAGTPLEVTKENWSDVLSVLKAEAAGDAGFLPEAWKEAEFTTDLHRMGVPSLGHLPGCDVRLLEGFLSKKPPRHCEDFVNMYLDAIKGNMSDEQDAGHIEPVGSALVDCAKTWQEARWLERARIVHTLFVGNPSKEEKARMVEKLDQLEAIVSCNNCLVKSIVGSGDGGAAEGMDFCDLWMACSCHRPAAIDADFQADDGDASREQALKQIFISLALIQEEGMLSNLTVHIIACFTLRGLEAMVEVMDEESGEECRPCLPSLKELAWEHLSLLGNAHLWILKQFVDELLLCRLEWFTKTGARLQALFPHVDGQPYVSLDVRRESISLPISLFEHHECLLTAGQADAEANGNAKPAEDQLPMFVDALVDSCFAPPSERWALSTPPSLADMAEDDLDNIHHLLIEVKVSAERRLRCYKAQQVYWQLVKNCWKLPESIEAEHLKHTGGFALNQLESCLHSAKEFCRLSELRGSFKDDVDALGLQFGHWREIFLKCTERKPPDPHAERSVCESYRSLRRIIHSVLSQGDEPPPLMLLLEAEVSMENSLFRAQRTIELVAQTYQDAGWMKVMRAALVSVQKRMDEMLVTKEAVDREKLAEELMADEAKLNSAIAGKEKKKKKKQEAARKAKAAAAAEQAAAAEKVSQSRDASADEAEPPPAEPEVDPVAEEARRRQAEFMAFSDKLKPPPAEEEWTRVPSSKGRKGPSAPATPATLPLPPAAGASHPRAAHLPPDSAGDTERQLAGRGKKAKEKKRREARAQAAGQLQHSKQPEHSSSNSAADGWQQVEALAGVRSVADSAAQSAGSEDKDWVRVGSSRDPESQRLGGDPDSLRAGDRSWDAIEEEEERKSEEQARAALRNEQERQGPSSAYEDGRQPDAREPERPVRAMPKGCLTCGSNAHNFQGCRVYRGMSDHEQRDLCASYGLPHRAAHQHFNRRISGGCFLCGEGHRLANCPELPEGCTPDEVETLHRVLLRGGKEAKTAALNRILDRIHGPPPPRPAASGREMDRQPDTSGQDPGSWAAVTKRRGKTRPLGSNTDSTGNDRAEPSGLRAQEMEAWPLPPPDLPPPPPDLPPPPHRPVSVASPGRPSPGRVTRPPPGSRHEEERWTDQGSQTRWEAMGQQHSGHASTAAWPPIERTEETDSSQQHRHPGEIATPAFHPSRPEEEESRARFEHPPTPGADVSTPWAMPAGEQEQAAEPRPAWAPPSQGPGVVRRPLPPGFGAAGFPTLPPDARTAGPGGALPPGFDRGSGRQKLAGPPITLSAWPAARDTSIPEAAEVEREDTMDDFMSLLGVNLSSMSATGPKPAAREPESAWNHRERAEPVPLSQWQQGGPPQPEDERDENDEDLQRALQASLVESSPIVPPTEDVVPSMQLSAVATPGLQNNTGEYNCFLNCIIQCLWHCRELRSHIQQWDPEQFEENAVVTALVELFRCFSEEEAQHAAGGKSERRRHVVTPAALRKALHEWSEQSFRMGEMSDAAEVLNAMYDNLALVADGSQLIDRIFQWHVHQYVLCENCRNKTSHDTSHTQTFYYTFATALREEAAADLDRGVNADLGTLIAREANAKKSCDKDTGGCGRLIDVKHRLQGGTRPARVFTLQLGWERAEETGEAIRDTMITIAEEIDIAKVFDGAKRTFVYGLRCMVCYYGLHYSAFVKQDGTWRLFDDAVTSEIGDWAAVQRKCFAGRIQPCVLFYEARWQPRKVA